MLDPAENKGISWFPIPMQLVMDTISHSSQMKLRHDRKAPKFSCNFLNLIEILRSCSHQCMHANHFVIHWHPILELFSLFRTLCGFDLVNLILIPTPIPPLRSTHMRAEITSYSWSSMNSFIGNLVNLFLHVCMTYPCLLIILRLRVQLCAVIGLGRLWLGTGEPERVWGKTQWKSTGEPRWRNVGLRVCMRVLVWIRHSIWKIPRGPLGLHDVTNRCLCGTPK